MVLLFTGLSSYLGFFFISLVYTTSCQVSLLDPTFHITAHSSEMPSYVLSVTPGFSLTITCHSTSPCCVVYACFSVIQ